MRRASLTAAMLGLLLAHVAATAPAQAEVRLVPAGSDFPQRSYRLTVPERRGLRPEDIKVTENGDSVSKLALTTSEGAGVGEFGTMIVIDASASMHGRAIRSALAAARELAKQRNGSQQLGVIVFNRTAQLLLAPTADQTAIDEVLGATPKLASQTRIFDAVGAALDELKRANISAGSIVVLSDGSDTGSLLAGPDVARRARAANVAIYAVGLRSRAFDTSGMKNLATKSRGRYIASESVRDVQGIFRDLGAQLASDYLIGYRSFAQPRREATVAVRVAGVPGIATSTYTVPGDVSFVQFEKSFWTSGLGIVLTALLSALLLALALAIVLIRRGQGPGLRERVSGFVSTPADVRPTVDNVLTGRAPGTAERSLERTKWWPAFKQDVEIARITTEPLKIVAGTALATLAFMFLLVKVTGIPLVGVFALAIPWAVRLGVGLKRDRQRGLFTEQLPDMLQGAASAIRAGQGLVAALSMVAEDGAEPIRSEFLRVVSDEALGVPLEDALVSVQERMESRDVMQIALIAQIQREAGGNMAEVLDRITESLRQRAELRRMVKALTAQGRLSRWIVTALPLALLLIISLLSPEYTRPLFTEALGLFMLAFAGLMMFIGSMVIGKIVNFKV